MNDTIKNGLELFSFFVTYCIKNGLAVQLRNKRGHCIKATNVCYNKDREALFIDCIPFGKKPERLVFLGLERFVAYHDNSVGLGGPNNPDGIELVFPPADGDDNLAENMYVRFVLNKCSYKTFLEKISIES